MKLKLTNFFFLKLKLNLSPQEWLVYVYYAGIITLMALFDYNHPKYFINQEDSQTNLTKSIYILLFAHIIVNFLSLSYNKFQDQTDSPYEFTRCVKIPVVAFLFFINDEFERIILMAILVFTVSYLKNISKTLNKPFFIN